MRGSAPVGAPTDLSPATALVRAAARHPGRTSLVWFGGGGPGPSTDEGGSTPHVPTAHLLDVEGSADTVRRLVTVLRRHGVSDGTRVALVAANSPWHFLVHTACAWLHAATVPLSPRRPTADLADLLGDCDPLLVLRGHGVPDAPAPAPGTAWETLGLDALAEEVAAAPPVVGTPPACSGELATLVHTSGSSGRPKAVELTHANLWWGSLCFREGFEYSPATDVVGVCAPLSHIGGLNGTALDMFSHGGTVVVTGDPFDPGHVLDCVERFRVTTMFVVPTMCRALLRAQSRRHADLSSWRLPLVGGDSLDEPLARSMRAVGLPPLHVWGMTETAGAGAFLHPDTPDVPSSSIGLPFDHVGLRLVDEGGTEVREAGHPGEIEVRGPGVTRGYFRRPLETAAARDGEWLRTGDLAQRDTRGHLHVLGRGSRMISTGGESVSPVRVEHALLGVPGVHGALVVGLPDEYWGQRVAALVVATPSARPTPAALEAHLGEVLAPWELPRTLEWVRRIPLTPAGKPDVAAARQLFLRDPGVDGVDTLPA